jgi:hypothetical protein
VRFGRGLAAAVFAVVVFTAGYLAGRGRRPVSVPALPAADTAPGSRPGGLEALGPLVVPAFDDTMELLLADLDNRIAALRAKSAPGGLEHVYSYYGRFHDARCRLRRLADPDSVAATRRQVVLYYRAAAKALGHAERQPGR